jgi:hypothetical protein
VDCDQIGGDYPQARQNCENHAEDKSGLEKRFSRIGARAKFYNHLAEKAAKNAKAVAALGDGTLRVG